MLKFLRKSNSYPLWTCFSLGWGKIIQLFYVVFYLSTKRGRIKELKKGKCRKLKFEGFSSPPINPCLAQAYPDRKVLNHRGSFACTCMDGTSCPSVVPLLPTKMKDRPQNKTTKNQKKHQSFLSVGALATPKVWFLNRPFLNKNKNI